MNTLPHPPGTLLTFPTVSFSRVAPRPTGRWGTILVLRHEDSQVYGRGSIVSILDRVTTTRPQVADVDGAGVMSLAPRLDMDGMRALTFMLLLEEADRQEWPALHVVGERPLTATEAGRAWNGMVPATALSFHVEMSWRAVHDPAGLERDLEEIRREGAEREAEIERRQRERLRGITLEQLLGETLLPEWEERAEYIPADFLEALRVRAREMLLALQSLGPKPRRPLVRAEMKAFVDWVNIANNASDAYPVETMEREELHAFLEEVAWAAKQRPLVDEIEDWRDW